MTTYSSAEAYAAIKQAEAENQVLFPQTSQTVHVGTFDASINKFHYDVQTGYRTYFTIAGGGGGGGKGPKNPLVEHVAPEYVTVAHAVLVGYVIVYAMDLKLSFSVLHPSNNFTVTMNGQTVTITTGGVYKHSAHASHAGGGAAPEILPGSPGGPIGVLYGNTATVDLGAFSTLPTSEYQVPGTMVRVSTGAHALEFQLVILRPPIATAGAFTLSALPTAIVYAPPPGPEGTNYAEHSSVTTISRTIATTVSTASSTKNATAYSAADFAGKLANFGGDIASFAAGLAGLGGTDAPGILDGFLGSHQGPSAASDLMAIGSGIKVVQDILDGLVPSDTSSTTTGVTASAENDLAMTDTTTLTQGTERGLGPGVGDRIAFLTNVKVAWAIVNNELSFTILGYDGALAFAVKTLAADLALLEAGGALSATQTMLDAATLGNLLSLDPLVQSATAPVLPVPRFVRNNPMYIGGSGTDIPGDHYQATHQVTMTDINTSTSVTTTITDSKPGWLVALFGSNNATEKQMMTTYSNGNTSLVGQLISSDVYLFAAAEEMPNKVWLHFDTLFGTFVYLPMDIPG